MAVELYPRSSHDAFHGMQIQYPPHVDEAVVQIVAATKGFGTDEQALITVLGSKSPETRTLIAMRYQELHRKKLTDLMKSETSGDFGRLLRMISTPLHETEATLLRDATKGVGTNENQVVQIISGRTNEEMDILKKTYFRLFNKDLAVTLSSELSGDLRKVVMAMLQSQQVPFNPTFHTAAKAEEEAIKLYKAGQGRLGTNEEVFIGIIVAAPGPFLKLMDDAYVRKYNNNIAKAVDKEFSGDAKKALQYLVKSVMDPFPTIAEVFEKTMKGFGTDETGLSTALVRYHCVLPQVKEAYKRLYGKELRDRIHGEISGDYRKLALQLYDAPQDAPRPKGAPVPGAAAPGAPGAMPGGAPGAPGAMPGAAPVPGAPQPGYAAPHGQAPGAPAAAPGGYPAPAPGQPGYPPQAHPSQPGYPPQAAPAGYPPQQAPGYPPAQPGYPPQGQHGYPPQQGYPPQGQPGYPPHGQPGYPPQQGYPPQGQPGYPPQGYPPPQGQPGYPPQQGFAQPGGYPPQGQPGYPPQQGYPPQGYPPQGQPGYPPQQGYPPQGYPPHGQPGGYPPQQGHGY